MRQQRQFPQNLRDNSLFEMDSVCIRDEEESSLVLPDISRELKNPETCKCRSDSFKRDQRYAHRSLSLSQLDFDIYHDNYRIRCINKNQLHNKTYIG